MEGLCVGRRRPPPALTESKRRPCLRPRVHLDRLSRCCRRFLLGPIATKRGFFSWRPLCGKRKEVSLQAPSGDAGGVNENTAPAPAPPSLVVPRSPPLGVINRLLGNIP